MLDDSTAGPDLGEYEQKRSKQKLSVFQMFTMFVKSTIGIGVFAYQYVYQNSGVPLGLALTFVFMTAVIYGIMRVVDFAVEVEKSSKPLRIQINSYSDLCAVVLPNMPKIGSILGPLVLVIVFFSNFGYCVISIITLDTTMQELFGISHDLSLIIILIGCLVAILIILEPEKLVYFAYFTISVVLLLLIISIIYGLIGLFQGRYIEETPRKLDLNSQVLSCGFVISSMEIVNFILNMRRMMKDKSKFSRVGYSSLAFCSTLFILPSLLLHTTYGDKMKSVDLYYKLFASNVIVRVLVACMSSVFLYHIVVNAICSVELLEKLKISQTLLRDSTHNLSSRRILGGRLIFLGLSVTTAYFVTDLKIVMAFVGIFLNTIIGLIIPGFIGICRPATIKHPRESCYFRFTDILILCLGLMLVVAYFGVKLL